MFTPEHEPVGLFIENGKVLRETKILKDPSVNFGIQPQGILSGTAACKRSIWMDSFPRSGIRESPWEQRVPSVP
jgi:uncharacterized protein YigE (DUF2233 family)